MASGYDFETLQQVQDDLVALVTAWADRGIPPSHACQVLAATSHKMIIELTDVSFGSLVALIARQWEVNGGKF